MSELVNTQREFKELVDRSLILLILQCKKCGKYVARTIYPVTAKLDKTCDIMDHQKESGHSSYNALKHIIVYMCQADKDLANEMSEIQRKAFDKFLATLK